MVRSSKLPVGISVTIPIKGDWGFAGFALSLGDRRFFVPHFWFFTDEFDAESSEVGNLGRLGEFLRLAEDSGSKSVAKVVRLSLGVVVVECASPESLLSSSCNLGRMG